jgi:hypothetical protein
MTRYNLFNFLSSSDRTILYHGASVTVQKDGFRPALHEIISNETGRLHKQIVNGIGGVGSLFGLCNLQNSVAPSDVIDLVIHECFTGDVNTGITPIYMLRDLLVDTLKSFPNSQHLFVLNFRSDKTVDELNLVADIYHSVASEFKVPLIRVFDLFVNGGAQSLCCDQLFRDGVHPTPDGALFIAKEIWRFMKDVDLSEFDHTPTLTSYIPSTRFEFLDISSIDKNIIGDYFDGQFEYKNTGQLFNFLEVTSDICLTLPSVKFLGFLALIGPNSPAFVNLTLNQDINRKFRTFDRNCYYFRPQTFSASTCLSVNDISFSLSNEMPDFSTCKNHSIEFESIRRFSICGLYIFHEA